jgi:hypothetical protein
MKKPNRTTQQARDGQVIVGVKKDLQNVTTLSLDGVTYTPTSLTALIQSRIDAINEVAIAKAKHADAIATFKALDTQVTGAVTGLKQYVMNALGKTSPLLADFGFAPRKVTVRTPEEKAATVAKAKATRAARGTKGPVAKLAVTGETVKLAALQAAAAQNAGPAPAPTAAPAPAPQPAPANGAPPAVTPPKA